MEKISCSQIAAKYSRQISKEVSELAEQEVNASNIKLVVLDDDPTGIQTVHGVSVYTDWSEASILDGFQEEARMFFVLTNSRSMSAEQSAAVHKEIAVNIVKAAKQTSKPYLIISRADSTLRGHYPLETQILKAVIEEQESHAIDGEIICPFFPEGGRYTVGDVHYVVEDDYFVPAGNTEFAKDKTFGYENSHLGMWVEEKTQGRYAANSLTYITIEELRSQKMASVYEKLLQVNGFSKVIVNALDYDDVNVFAAALYRAIAQGKRFIVRSAAGIVKALGGIEERALLGREELVDQDNPHGGIILVGSHVQKTTKQLAKLRECPQLQFIEFNVHLVLNEVLFKNEIQRVIAAVEQAIIAGETVAVFTRRERLDVNTGNKEDELQIARTISDAVTSIIAKLSIRPRFIIAKGGITSSDVGTKGLGVKKALAYGQILPGVPVWLTGPESKFPNMPYVIFPGNVGSDAALQEAVEKMGIQGGRYASC